MNTRGGHIALAEELLDEARQLAGDQRRDHIAAAHVHATLAALYPTDYDRNQDE